MVTHWVKLEDVLAVSNSLCFRCKAHLNGRLASLERKKLDGVVPQNLWPVVEEALAESGCSSLEQLTEKDNSWYLVRARRRIAVEGRRLGLSFPLLARVLHRDHSTIVYLVNGKKERL